MASSLVWILLNLLLSVRLACSSDIEGAVTQIKTLTHMISQQNTEMISKFGEIKVEIKQEVKEMINETMNNLLQVQTDVATFKHLLDTDECSEFTHNCSYDAKCIDTRTSFRCQCKSGFQGDGYTCEDIDECANEDICGENSVCVNKMGDYNCRCNEGYHRKNGLCEDINECEIDDTCHKYAECINTPGSFQCICPYFSEGDGLICKDKDMECREPFKNVRGVGCIAIASIGEFSNVREYCQSLGGDLFEAINPKHFLRLAYYGNVTEPGAEYYVGVKDGVWFNGREVEPSELSSSSSDETDSCAIIADGIWEDLRLIRVRCYYDAFGMCEYKDFE